MTSKFLKVFLLLAIIALVVNAQKKEEVTNDIDQCIKREKCAPEDRKCRAACAGVPSPDPKTADATQKCYAECDQKSDIKTYTECTKNCREKVYQEDVLKPGSQAPGKGKSSDNDADAGNATKNDNETDDDDNEGNKSDKDSASSSISAWAGYVHVFAAVLACVVFGIGL